MRISQSGGPKRRCVSGTVPLLQPPYEDLSEKVPCRVVCTGVGRTNWAACLSFWSAS
jgi:hypothetical protein